jgi:hypothetical protein
MTRQLRIVVLITIIMVAWCRVYHGLAQVPQPCVTPESCGGTDVGNGSHDDTAAIQTAINNLQSLGTGGAVPFRAATYVITQPLKITKPGVGLRGVHPGWPGGGGTFIVQKTPNIDGIEVVYNPGDNIYGNFVENLGIVSGGNADSDQNTAGSGILVRGALGTKLRDVVVLNAYMGIHIISGINVEVADCNIQRLYHVPVYSVGIMIEDDGTHPNASNWVNDTIISFPDQHDGIAVGLEYNGIMQDFMARHIEVDHATDGLVFIRKGGAPSFDVQLSDVVIDQFFRYGAHFQGFTNGSPSIVGGWFANAPRGGEQAAILAQGSQGTKATGIEFFGYNNGNKDSSAIKLVGDSGQALIDNNSFRNWNNDIIVDSTANVVIKGNSFINWDSGAANPGAIYNSHIDIINSSNRININANTFTGNGNTGRSVLIESGTFNLISSNTWTGPYVGGFYLDLTPGTPNREVNNFGN